MSAETAGTERRTDWVLILAIWAAGLGAAAQYGKISVIFDRLPEVYPDAGTALGFAVSLVGFLGIVLGVGAGVFVSRIGYRRALLGGLLAGAAVSAAQAFFPPLPVFLGLRVVEGAAHLAIVVAAPTLIAQLAAERDRGGALTLWGSFFGVAFAVLAWAGVALAARFGLWSLMAAHAVYMAAMAAMLWPWLPKVELGQSAVTLAELLEAHLRIYTSPRIGAAAAGWVFYTACFVSALTLLPSYIPQEARAFTMGAMPLMSILSSLTLGVWLLRTISPVSVVVLGFVVSAGAALALAAVEGSPAFALLLGGGLGLVQGASFAVVPQLNEEDGDRALGNGGLAQAGNLGNTIGTPLMVWVVSLAGYGGMMGSLAAILLAGACVHLALAALRR